MTPIDISEISALVSQLLGLVSGGKLVMGLALGLLFTTKAFLKFGPRLPGKFGEWFLSPLASWLIPIVTSVIGALLTALGSSTGVTLDLVLAALIPGLVVGGMAKPMTKEQAILELK